MKRTQSGMLVLWGLLLVCVLGLGILCPAIASAQERSAEAVHFNTLIEYLPDAPSGWDGEEPTGQMLTLGEGTYSMAIGGYTKSGATDVTAEVAITDYAIYTTGWSAAWQSFVAYESTEGYIKSVTVKGNPAWEVHDKEGNDYGLHIGIGDRFLVIIATNSDRDTLYEFADAIDYDGIADLSGDEGAAPSTTTVRPTSPAETSEPVTEPERDDEGETPGFELVTAVIGLVAVCALVRRRV